ncbi:DUF3611 family protein [Leptothoe kymatousa]|uniref:DUF3611 family protein n=1 Tax=Leptothoe kymatousa TAU-MAC 1615 TaxID=2364775 RepID=A0ABS5XYI2_9CYAN|nr:DUF3611 family protein [Leptothoe kymatousa]MBT9310643.1 DUF3611 family protein [Leptothoe kymatousa TAU-MAC 1615]
MTGELGYSLPPAIRRIANNFRLVGWVSFWVQIVSGVIATLLFVTSLLGLQSVSSRSGAENAAAGSGFLLAALGLAAVYVGVFWAFQYTRFARKLKSSNPDLRPKPKNAAKIVATGLTISVLGMFFGLLGSGGVVGSLMLKVISQPQSGNIAVVNPTLAVEPLDVFLVQATINTLISHFAGIVGSLWLSRTINKQS